MEIQRKTGFVTFLYIVTTFTVNAKYLIPDVKIEALRTGGFRAIIPDIPSTTFFRLTASINAEISVAKPGQLSSEINTSTSGFFVVEFSEKLNVNDVLFYEIEIHHDRLGYFEEDLSWTVQESDLKDIYSSLELTYNTDSNAINGENITCADVDELDGQSVAESTDTQQESPTCKKASTTINGKRATCIGELIISDGFDGPSVDTKKWIVEQRIPTYSDYEEKCEFNSYENIPETRFFKQGVLYLKSVALNTEAEVRGMLDLTDGCTSNDNEQCFYPQRGSFLLPPVKSGRIKSTISFKYGKIEIKAKLPAGEWIIPVIQLEPNYQKFNKEILPKIWVAYSRGNEHLINVEGDDIGSNLLYAGPVFNATEPDQNENLIKRTSNTPYSDDFHVYQLNWTPDKLLFYVDGALYGKASGAGFKKEYLLTLGVAVGGFIDFPDNSISGNNPKPWSNTERNCLKGFFQARDTWLDTWNGDNSALQIDYVKVWAV